MKKEISKSRALRRRLLSVLLICLITIMIIFVSVFDIVYKRSTNIVTSHTSKIAGKTVDTTAHGFYQVTLGNLQLSLESFGTNICTVLGSLQDTTNISSPNSRFAPHIRLEGYWHFSPPTNKTAAC